MTGSHEMRCGLLRHGPPEKSVNSTPSRVTTAISSIAEEHDVARVAEDRREYRTPRRTRRRRGRRRSAGRCGPRRSSPDRPPRSAPARTAAHQQQRPPHRVLEAVALHLALDQVRDDLGVGLGDERVPFRLQLALQIEVVLDDPVVDDDDAAGAVAVRMRVLFGRPAVRRPARVADAVVALERIDADDAPRAFDSLPALRRISIRRARRRRPPSRSRDIRAGGAPRSGRENLLWPM